MTDTHCVDCRFYNKHITPTHAKIEGCDLKKHKQYKKHGIEIEQNLEYHCVEDKEYLWTVPTLKNFICPFKRTFEHVMSDELKKATTKKEIEDVIIKENGFPYAAFVYENGDIDIKEAVSQILHLDHAPKYLHITFKYMNEDKELLKELVRMIEGHKNTIKYKLVINLDEKLDHFYESYLAFRLNLLESPIPFIAIYFDNHILDPTLTSHLSYRIQKDLLSFPYAMTSTNNEFMIFHKTILEEYISIEGEHFIKKILETQCQGYKL